MYKIIGRNKFSHLYELDGVFTLEAANAFMEKAYARANKMGYFISLDISQILDI